MTMIVHMFMMMFSLLPLSKNRAVKFTVLVVLAAILTVFFNMSVSVIRAAIMLIIFYGGEAVMRKNAVLNSMGLALLLILLFEPYAVTDAGLLMSFSGTFGVGVLAPIVNNRVKYRLIHPIIVTVCASVSILPISAIFFGGVGVFSPIMTVLILPFFTIAAMAMVMFSVVAAFAIIAPIGQACLLIAGAAVRIMGGIISFFGQFDLLWIALDYWFVPIWAGLAIVAVAVIRGVCKCSVKAVKAGCISIAALALMICVYNAAAVKSGRVYIEIYSDTVAAFVNVRYSGSDVTIATQDRRIVNINNDIVLSDSDYGIYDISGKFTLNVGEDEVMLEIGDYNFTILFTRASDDNATPANITVASGAVGNKREFKSDYTVYVSRSVHTSEEHEHNAYYEPFYLILTERDLKHE
jgi:ComEC/Rec2-related protein